MIDHVDEQLEGDAVVCFEHVAIEKRHGCVETRACLQLPAAEGPPGFGPRKGLKSIGMATSHRVRGGEETVEVRYGIGGSAVDVGRSPASSEAAGAST